MTRLFGLVFIAMVLGSPAQAHKLKVFAAVEGDAVSGYAFFIGGGRPEGSAWIAKDASGNRIAEGSTDGEGRFAFDLPKAIASAVTITVDTHEAHIASTTLAASRLGPIASDLPPTAALEVSAAPAATPDPQLAALVSTAVQKQVEPLLERIEQMDARLRFVDVLSGIFLIIGLVGIGLWASGRRR
ncbi:nickel transport protein [Kaistia soli DSM 19436]|uniref:Nickel transport protein n=1 Tax=Kaistia soli DSM 19436 TaxID=1122133 RepID=A0A1M5I986_9HYPH|nr:cobalamin biosynthesis protein CbiL [Kaistia soli]SHG24679.1 nickel transport protein [Kaistia soli DSM 19436]